MSSLLQLRERYIVPPGGFWYHDIATDMKIVGGDFESLLVACRRHRMANAIHIPADFNAQIEDTICRRIPSAFCVPARPKTTYTMDDTATPNAKVQVLQKVWQEIGCLLCDADEAEQRALVCRYCMKNKPGACLSCNGVYDWLREKFNIPSLTEDKWLNMCGVDRVYNKAQVHLTKEVFIKLVRADRIDVYPQTCWKRKILEQHYAEQKP